MAHSHDHAHGNYYLDQILIVAFCGALGVVMILLGVFNVLPIILNAKFHAPLLWGAIALLFLVAVRAISLWGEAGRVRLAHAMAGEHHHDHEHCEHDHDHGHEHAHCDHGHDHAHGDHGNDHEHAHSHGDEDGHEHGFAPWRYMVLVLPIALFALKLPWPDPPEKLPENLMAMKLDAAEQSATSPDQRSFWKTQSESKSVVLKGLFDRPYATDKVFRFMKLKMTCCAADAYADPTKVYVKSAKSLNFDDLKKRGPWVKVIGKMTYSPAPDGQFITIIDAESVKPIKTPANQFDN